jgi:NAD-dependent dihydropyrimidine dehydrogenase PreA subunit
LAISKDPNAFTGPGAAVLGKNVSKDEALKVLAEAEAAGCVHSTINVDIDNWTTLPICNCCDCCCEFLKAYNTADTPQMYAKDHLACIDQDTCIECGVCKDERCPVQAIAEDNGAYTVLEERCIGCGACTITCPVAAISIEKKDSGKKLATKLDWMAARAKSRGKEFPGS